MLVEFSMSIKEIIEVQVDVINALCKQEHFLKRIGTIGEDLFKVWSRFEYRRLTEHELKMKQIVMDGAKSLKEAGFSSENASPVMILLVSTIYEIENSCLEWAQNQISDVPLPANIQAILNP